MNRKALEKRSALISFAQKKGWSGDSLESLKNWMLLKNYDAVQLEGSDEVIELKNFDEIWGKGVVITIPDNATSENVQVDDMVESAEADEDEIEEKAEDDEDDEAEAKQFLAWKAANAAKSKRSMDAIRKVKGINAAASLRTSKTGYNSREAKIKAAYDRAANDGSLIRGKRPVFSSADEAEQFGAAFRLMATKGGHRAYSKLNEDLGIIGKTAGSTTDNAWAGTLIVSETAPQIMDLLHEYGATRMAVGVTDMPDGVYDTKRKTANMSFGYVDENGAFSETNPSYDQVELVAKKAGGIARLSNEMLNDSAFSLADEVARSSAAGAALFEDEEYFNGTYGTHGGLLGAVDADSTYDATLSSSWDDYTITKIQNWIAKVPAEAWKSKTVAMCGSLTFYNQVLNRFAMQAGGNTGNDLKSGFGDGLHWGGIPYIVTEVLPSAYSANQIVAFIGSFERGTKFGVVRGSEELSSSSERYWDNDQFAWRYKERIAFNFHDVGGTSSEVIALKD